MKSYKITAKYVHTISRILHIILSRCSNLMGELNLYILHMLL